MRKLTFAVLAFLAAFACGEASAQTKNPAPLDANALIDQCRATSTEYRKFAAADPIRMANERTVSCLKQLVIEQIDVIFEPGKERRDARALLNEAEESHMALSRAIFNANPKCDLPCPAFAGLERTRLAYIFASLGRDAVWIRNRLTDSDVKMAFLASLGQYRAGF